MSEHLLVCRQRPLANGNVLLSQKGRPSFDDALGKVMREKLLTVSQAAEELNVTPRYIRHLTFERRIDYIKIGALVRIPSTAIDDLVEQGLRKATRRPSGTSNPPRSSR